MSGAFLNVDHSLTGRLWLDRLDGVQVRMAAAISQQHELPDLLGRILAGYGVLPETCHDFLAPSLRSSLPDPSVLRAMDVAAGRIAEAVQNGESIAVFGDYDVDGAASCAILLRFLRSVGSDAKVYIPDRISEGYGPNLEAFRSLAESGVKLIICVDCGAAGSPAFDWAQAEGLDVLVFDHHQMSGLDIPPVLACVNPARHDDVSGLETLAAVGVVFLGIVAVNRILRQQGWFTGGRAEPALMPLLSIVALGTVCDVVPLTGLNRVFVQKGLQMSGRFPNPGLQALLKVVRFRGLPCEKTLGFSVGPCINAGGRVGRSDLGARLLSSDDLEEVHRLAVLLNECNRERKDIEKRICDEVMLEVESRMHAHGDDDSCILVAGDDWHPGVIGLIASRLKDRFHRPAIAIAFNGTKVGTGSGRSVSGVDLGSAVRHAVREGLLIKGGGHAMAAGLRVQKAKVEELRTFLERVLPNADESVEGARILKLDASLTAKSAKVQILDILAKAGPFGTGCPEPCFAFASHWVDDVRPVGEHHLRCVLRSGDGFSLSAVLFRHAATPLGRILQQGLHTPVHVAGYLGASYWKGSRSLELRIADMAHISAGAS